MADFNEKLINAATQGNLLEVLYDLRQTENISHEELSLALVRINIDHGIDVVGHFGELKSTNDTHRFFDLRRLLELALAKMNCLTEETMRCVLHLTAEAGQDMTAGCLFEPYIEFCSKVSVRAEEALNLVINDKDLQDMLSPVLQAGSRLDLVLYHDIAVTLTQDGDIAIRTGAVHSLGQLLYDEETSLIENSMTVLTEIVARETDDLLLANALKAMVNLYLQNRDLGDDLTSNVADALNSGASAVLHAASELLAFNAKDLPTEILPILSEHLIKVPPANGGTINNIGFGLAALLKFADPAEGIKLLEELLKASDGATTIDALGSVRTTIVQSRALLNKLATRWFLSGNPFLGRAIARIIEHEYGNTPALAVDPEELPNTDFAHIYFVARKAIGFLFLYPFTAVTFVLSLIDLTSGTETPGALKELLFDPLMLSFPGPLKKTFEPYLSGDFDNPSAMACAETSERFESYITDIKTAGKIIEHHPPQSHQELYVRHFTREMSDAMKSAEKNSVFLSMVKKSVLLYGRKWITYVESPNQPTRRTESPLQSFETSMDMPRIQNIDPVGLDYMLRAFRVEQLKS